MKYVFICLIFLFSVALTVHWVLVTILWALGGSVLGFVINSFLGVFWISILWLAMQEDKKENSQDEN